MFTNSDAILEKTATSSRNRGVKRRAQLRLVFSATATYLKHGTECTGAKSRPLWGQSAIEYLTFLCLEFRLFCRLSACPSCK